MISSNSSNSSNKEHSKSTTLRLLNRTITITNSRKVIATKPPFSNNSSSQCRINSTHPSSRTKTLVPCPPWTIPTLSSTSRLSNLTLSSKVSNSSSRCRLLTKSSSKCNTIRWIRGKITSNNSRFNLRIRSSHRSTSKLSSNRWTWACKCSNIKSIISSSLDKWCNKLWTSSNRTKQPQGNRMLQDLTITGLSSKWMVATFNKLCHLKQATQMRISSSLKWSDLEWISQIAEQAKMTRQKGKRPQKTHRTTKLTWTTQDFRVS